MHNAVFSFSTKSCGHSPLLRNWNLGIVTFSRIIGGMVSLLFLLIVTTNSNGKLHLLFRMRFGVQLGNAAVE